MRLPRRPPCGADEVFVGCFESAVDDTIEDLLIHRGESRLSVINEGKKLVTCNIVAAGRDITVQAESSAEPRRTIMEMFPGSVVTGVSRNQVR